MQKERWEGGGELHCWVVERREWCKQAHANTGKDGHKRQPKERQMQRHKITVSLTAKSCVCWWHSRSSSSAEASGPSQRSRR